MKCDAQAVLKQANAIKDGVINTQNYNIKQFNSSNTENVMLSKRYESTGRP